MQLYPRASWSLRHWKPMMRPWCIIGWDTRNATLRFLVFLTNRYNYLAHKGELISFLFSHDYGMLINFLFCIMNSPRIHTHLSRGPLSGGAGRSAWSPLCSAGPCRSSGPVSSPLKCWPGTGPASPCHLSCSGEGPSDCSLAQNCCFGCIATSRDRGRQALSWVKLGEEGLSKDGRLLG